MTMNKFLRWISSIILALTSGLVAGYTAAQSSGFMDDYSIFEKPDAEAQMLLEGALYMDQLWVIPGVAKRATTINAIMVDQPEVWVNPESPKKGVKPDAIKILADTLRMNAIEELSKHFEIVETPGPGVLHLHWAITDLYLAKKKKSFLTYMPINFVITSAKDAMIRDIWKKVEMVEMTIEIEAIDTETDEVLAAAIVAEGARKDRASGQKKRDPVTWEELDAFTHTFTARLACRINNLRLEPAQRGDCQAVSFVVED